MKTVFNILWLLLSGIWMAIGYVVAAFFVAITIIGLPFAKQAVKLAGHALWPFGRTLVPSATRHKGLSVVGNVLWFVLAGWWLALGHLVTGVLLCITIIGIPLGIADFKMAGAALVPFGKQVVNISDSKCSRPEPSPCRKTAVRRPRADTSPFGKGVGAGLRPRGIGQISSPREKVPPAPSRSVAIVADGTSVPRWRARQPPGVSEEG
jgi:uncharacterized membrane protein YccF (DUF307 family)